MGLLNNLRDQLSSRSLAFYNKNFCENSKINSVLVPLKTAVVAVNVPMGRSWQKLPVSAGSVPPSTETGKYRHFPNTAVSRLYAAPPSSLMYYFDIQIKDIFFEVAVYFQPQSTSG